MPRSIPTAALNGGVADFREGFNCASDCSFVLHDIPGLGNLDAGLPGTLAN
jgi:hypothetical protein